MHTKQIVILSKNAENNNFHIAGLANTGEWVRPISDSPAIENAVPREAIIFPDNSELQLLDVVEISMLENKPVNNPIQPENFYYDSQVAWKKINHVPLKQIINSQKYNHRPKIFYSYENSVDSEFVRRQTKRESILFLPVRNLAVGVEISEDNKKIFANFNYNGKNYQRFGISDNSVMERFKNKDAGEYFFKNRATILFSLTNPQNDGRCYKMVAQVF